MLLVLAESLKSKQPMEYLRTPNERFTNLPGYNFVPHYAQIGELRMHRVS
jgi:hypothetical protein